MKALIVCAMAMFLPTSAFSQKSRASSDSTVKPYLTYSCSMHAEYVSNVEGKCPVCNRPMNLSPKEQMKAEVVKLYTCPMHPNVLCTKSGKCPDCKMDMVEFKSKKKIKQG